MRNSKATDYYKNENVEEHQIIDWIKEFAYKERGQTITIFLKLVE
jgi:hypothetical protein